MSIDEVFCPWQFVFTKADFFCCTQLKNLFVILVGKILISFFKIPSVDKLAEIKGLGLHGCILTIDARLLGFFTPHCLRIWTSLQYLNFFFFQGKSVIRPIAFRPTPGASSGSSTPTNGYVVSSYRPNSANMQAPHFDYSGPPHIRASPATSTTHMMMGPGHQPPLPPLPPGHPGSNGEGYPPGHPLVKDGKRHYGSRN